MTVLPRNQLNSGKSIASPLPMPPAAIITPRNNPDWIIASLNISPPVSAKDKPPTPTHTG